MSHLSLTLTLTLARYLGECDEGARPGLSAHAAAAAAAAQREAREAAELEALLA